MNKEVMRENLISVDKVLQRHHISYMLAFGTLLGAVRENDLLPWDNDSDLIIEDSHKFKFPAVREDLETIGFFIPSKQPEKDTHVIRNGEKVEMWWFKDISLTTEVSKYVYNDKIWYRKDELLDTYIGPFLGYRFPFPQKPDKVLERTYGMYWRVPNKHQKGFS